MRLARTVENPAFVIRREPAPHECRIAPRATGARKASLIAGACAGLMAGGIAAAAGLTIMGLAVLLYVSLADSGLNACAKWVFGAGLVAAIAADQLVLQLWSQRKKDRIGRAAPVFWLASAIPAALGLACLTWTGVLARLLK